MRPAAGGRRVLVRHAVAPVAVLTAVLAPNGFQRFFRVKRLTFFGDGID